MPTYKGDSRQILPRLPDNCADLVLTDPPYEDPELLNLAVREGRRLSKGAVVVFMYAEDVWDLDTKPEQIVHWTKPISTKNTSKKYSRFVEVACIWHGPYFNQNLHWSARAGIFTDRLIDKQSHPHQKPYSLIATLIKTHAPPLKPLPPLMEIPSKEDLEEVNGPGPYILDPFAGSGTVPHVANCLGYHGVGIEMSDKYTRGCFPFPEDLFEP